MQHTSNIRHNKLSDANWLAFVDKFLRFIVFLEIMFSVTPRNTGFKLGFPLLRFRCPRDPLSGSLRSVALSDSLRPVIIKLAANKTNAPFLSTAQRSPVPTQKLLICQTDRRVYATRFICTSTWSPSRRAQCLCSRQI